MYWATPEEIAEWHEHQNEKEQAQPQAEIPAKPAYRSFTYRDENGHRVSASVRRSEPVVIDGFLI